MRMLFKYLRPHRGAVVLIVLFIFLQSLANLYLPTLMAKIVNFGVIPGDIPYIWHMGGWMLLVSILAVVLSVSAGFLSSRTSSDFGRVVRQEVFTHVEQFSLSEFDEFGTSSLITRATNDITQVQQLVNMMLRMMIMAPLNFIGGILMAVYTDAKLSLVIVVMLPVVCVAIFLVFRRATVFFRAMQGKIDVLNRVLRENLTGIRVVRSFNRVAYETRRFDAANFDLTNTTTQAQKTMAVLMPTLMLIINLSTIAIIWFGGIRISSGQMQVGSLIAFIQYVMQLLFSIMMVSMMFFMIPRAAASADRIRKVLETEPTIEDPKVGASVPERNSSVGTLRFEDVTFSYPGAEKPALTKVTFEAKRGEVTAIIGGTGAGKSTLVNLIPRFYDVEEGAVLVDGVDVRNYTQAQLRAKLGYVPQKAVLFSGTIAENIRYGQRDASDEAVMKSAEIAQASEFIEEMPGQYDAVVEHGGQNLSGGQKQRLSIARALVRPAEIYLFDDSFSALDAKTDAALRSRLKQSITEATVLIVAQRVTTVIDADQIVVLDEGQVAGIGKHKELMETCQVYREIVASQLAKEDIA